MKELKNYTQPQNVRIQPAKMEVEDIKFEIIPHDDDTNVGKIIGGVIVHLGSKAIDHGADITKLVIVHGFKTVGQITIGFFNLIGLIGKGVWNWWTTCPDDDFDRRDNYGQHQHGQADNRTIIIENHYHF